jgi:anti-sigma factor RsiW
MNEAEYQELLEASWRGELSPAEFERLEAGLAARPEWRARWLEEAGLNQLLDRMPDAPVPSNFTALVLQEARRECAASTAPEIGSRSFLAELWTRLFARPAIGAAWVAVMAAMCWVAVQHSSERQRNSELAVFFKAAAPSDPVLLQDFDAIRLLPEDEELFAVLSK